MKGWLWSLLLVAAVLTGCTGPQEAPQEEAARCTVFGFEDLPADDQRCIAEGIDASPVRKAWIQDHVITYSLVNHVMNEESSPQGPSMKIRPYLHSLVRADRMQGIDFVAIEVSDVCPVGLWEESNDYNLGCGRSPSKYYTPVTPDQAAVFSDLDTVAELTLFARASGREVIFGVKCVEKDTDQPDGATYTGPPGCPK